jgi:nitroreductase
MLSPDALLTQLRWRYAAKSFDSSRKVPDEAWDALEQALVLTPSSYGLQPWKFLVIRDPMVREQLRAASWNQRQVTEASHYVVFTKRVVVDEAYVDHYVSTMAALRGVEVGSLERLRQGIVGDVVNGPRSKLILEWAARQVYIALGNFMTSAAMIGVDTCPMEGLDPARYDEILGLKDGLYRTVVACAAGYRNPEDKLATAAKVRFLREDLVQTI